MTKMPTKSLAPGATPTAAQMNSMPKTGTTGKDTIKRKPRATEPMALHASFVVGASQPIEFAVWRSTRQILQEFPISEKTLYNLRTAGILPYGLLGRKILYNRTVIEKILLSRWNVVVAMLQLLYLWVDC
jgi:hypothetical protein